MRSWIMAVVCAGCTGTTAEPSGPGAPTQQPPAEAASAEAELLAKGPTELGPAGLVATKLAEKYGVGVVRCPLAGNGRARQIYGNERDQLRQMGVLWASEIDPATAPPWDPLFDEVTSENGWVTLLAAPGTTHAWVTTKASTLAYEFPAAVAGGSVTCTSAHPVRPRMVRGKVIGEARDAYVVPCTGDKPPQVGGDGTFIATATVPCRLWIEAPAARSKKVDVTEGAEPLELELTIERDPLQNDDRSWSPAGRKLLADMVARERERNTATESVIDEVFAAFEGNAEAQVSVKRWKFDHATWMRGVEATAKELEAPPPTTP
ncbi:MAG: hypothetical protein ABMA64_23515 [Myxococcota bacterium]